LSFQLNHLNDDFRYCLNYYQPDQILKILEDAECLVEENAKSSSQLLSEKSDTNRYVVELLYHLIIYYFLSDNFLKTKELSQHHAVQLLQNLGQDIGIDYDKLETIKTICQTNKSTEKDENEIQSEEKNVKTESSNFEEDRQIKEEKEVEYLDSIPFKITELSFVEKQQLADHLFYEYFQSLGIFLIVPLRTRTKTDVRCK
jgi:hypothetical protein